MNSTITNRWTTAAGYEAVIIERAGILGEPRCLDGYVLLDDSHPWHGIHRYRELGSDRLPFRSGVATISEDGELLVDGVSWYDMPTAEGLLRSTPPVSWSDGVIGIDGSPYGIGITMGDIFLGHDKPGFYMDSAHLTTQLESLAAQLKLVEECNTLSELIAKLEEMR